MASRKLSDLTAEVEQKARQVLTKSSEIGFDLLIYCTWRSLEDQARLYRRGREYADIMAMANRLENEFGRVDLKEILLGVGAQYEKMIVTQAAPGMSLHNYRLAFDSVPLRNGRPIWLPEGLPKEKELDEQFWQIYGELLSEFDLEWGGNWTGFIDYPHAQEPGVNWRDLIKDWDFKEK